MRSVFFYFLTRESRDRVRSTRNRNTFCNWPIRCDTTTNQNGLSKLKSKIIYYLHPDQSHVLMGLEKLAKALMEPLLMELNARGEKMERIFKLASKAKQLKTAQQISNDIKLKVCKGATTFSTLINVCI